MDLEEQEQLAKLRAFWQDYGRWIATGVALALIAFGGYWGYSKYQNQQSAKASVQYETLLGQLEKNDLPAVLATAKKLQLDFPKTAYAGMSGLLAANLAHSVQDKEATLAQLLWVANSAQSESFQAIAKLRLILVLIDQKTPESLAQADQLLGTPFAAGFAALKLERRGDWHWAQDQTDLARKSYLAAWNILTDEKLKELGKKDLDPALKKIQQQNPGPDQRLLKVKIDSLGGF